MIHPSYAAFHALATRAGFDRALRITESDGRVEQRTMPSEVCGAVVRWLGKLGPTSRWAPVVDGLTAMAAREEMGWRAFEHALSVEFGDSAARCAVEAVRTNANGSALTAGAVQLARFHLCRHPEAARRHGIGRGGRLLALPPRKFETRPPTLAKRRGDARIRLNGEVRMAGGKDLAVCRHLAMLWELEFLSNDGKVSYETLGSAAAIRRHTPPGLDAVIKARQFHSPQCLRLVTHAEWGAELVRHFEDMAQRGETLRTVYVMSSGYGELHAMMLGLKIRTDVRAPGRRGHVVDLYDPNLTATHVRCAVGGDLAALARLQAGDLFAPLPMDPAGYYDYPVSWFSCPAASHWTVPNRFPDDFLVPLAMWGALRTNHAAVIDECEARLVQLPASTQGALLLAQVDGTAGLFWALSKGHAEAIRAWGRLLAVSKLDTEVRAEMLEGRHADGDPGAAFADPRALAAWEDAIDGAGLEPRQRETLRALRALPAGGGRAASNS